MSKTTPITYVPDPEYTVREPKKRKTMEEKKATLHKKKTMYRLMWHLLKTANIKLEEGETYRADKDSSAMSELYNICGKDEVKTKALITRVGGYFNRKNLSWTIHTIVRDYRFIDDWEKKDEEKNKQTQRPVDVNDKRTL